MSRYPVAAVALTAVALTTVAACHGAATSSSGQASTPSPVAPPATGAPCFPERATLDGAEVFKQLEHYGRMSAPDPEHPPSGTFGTCTISDSTIRTAAGAVVGEVNCGLAINVPGIRDDAGVQVGGRGANMLVQLPEVHQPLVCRSDGPDQVRCNLARAEEDDTDPSWYVVSGALPAGTDVLTGADAEAFFGDRTLVEIELSVDCH